MKRKLITEKCFIN